MTAMRDLAHAQALVREALAFRPTPADAFALADGLAADRVGLGPLWQLLVGANLLPFAGVLLDWHGAGERLEASQAAFLRASTEQNAVRQAVLLRRAAEATRRLASQGIEATWLKGAWISARIVERPAMRYMEDIDLLVATAQFDAARSALVAMGFERELAADAVDPRIPSIALSQSMLAFHDEVVPYWETAEHFGPGVVRRLLEVGWPVDVVMNVNFPSRPPGGVTEVEVTRQGFRDTHIRTFDKRTDLRGRDYYWMGFSGKLSRPEDGTDLKAIYEGKISITPLHIDLTHRESVNKLKGLIGGVPPKS